MEGRGWRDWLYAARQPDEHVHALIKEVKVTAPARKLRDSTPRDYSDVSASDAEKETSEFQRNIQIQVVRPGQDPGMMLEIEAPESRPLAELVGKTEPGAARSSTPAPVPNISPDGTFRHFTEPLEPGQHNIVVIGQNRRGGTANRQISIVIPK